MQLTKSFNLYGNKPTVSDTVGANWKMVLWSITPPFGQNKAKKATKKGFPVQQTQPSVSAYPSWLMMVFERGCVISLFYSISIAFKRAQSRARSLLFAYSNCFTVGRQKSCGQRGVKACFAGWLWLEYRILFFHCTKKSVMHKCTSFYVLHLTRQQKI